MSDRKVKQVGVVTHYFSKISVAVAELTDTLSVGDRILFSGATTNFEQTVASMQIEHVNITMAQGGQSIGMKVEQRARKEDKIYKIM
ncbi:MAG: translation elongation factor-like protein [Candidatus Bathyarchaeota archaeon]|nr:translation elongation factor-like protein [Candidatus Bathyarchaeota archaeon]